MQRLRGWRYWSYLRDGVIAVLVLVAIRAYQKRDMVSGPAPALVGPDLRGASVQLGDYRGKPVLVHFWATWCGVCKAEQHNIDAVAQDLPVLSVASRSGAATEVAAYTEEHGMTLPVVVDEDGQIAGRYGVHLFPSSFVVDGEGRIRSVEVGYTTELGLRVRMWLARWSPIF